MTRLTTLLLCGWLIFGAGSALIAAPGQGRAGESDASKVSITNRGSDDAIPVAIEVFRPEKPVPVQLTGMSAVTVAEPVRRARQAWEYRMLPVSPGPEFAPQLMNAGRDGWEVTGVQVPMPGGGTAVILKRPQ